jgi:hypothetical protein
MIMKTQHSIALLFLMLFLSACGSTKLFYANFDADTVGEGPNEYPPGDPELDHIYYTNSPVYGPVLQVVNIDEFDQHGNSIRYSATGQTNTYYRLVSFQPSQWPNPDPSTTEYFVFWTGKLEVSSNSPALDVGLSDDYLPYGRHWAVLRFKNGRILLLTNVRLGDSETFEEIGSYETGSKHSILIHVDIPSATYDITILQDGREISTSTRHVLNPETIRHQTMPLIMCFCEYGENTPGSYLVDNVIISKRAPGDFRIIPR